MHYPEQIPEPNMNDDMKTRMQQLAYYRDMALDLADLKASLKLSRLGVKSAQDKYQQLHDKVYQPWEAQPTGTPKLLGFTLRNRDGSPSTWVSPKQVFDLLSVLNRLLAVGQANRMLAIIPIFEGDIEEPEHLDERDLEDGDFATG